MDDRTSLHLDIERRAQLLARDSNGKDLASAWLMKRIDRALDLRNRFEFARLCDLYRTYKHQRG